MKVVYLTNVAPPYRIPLFDKLKNSDKYDFTFIFCSKSESNRSWHVQIDSLRPSFLKEEAKTTRDGFNYLHIDWNIFTELFKIMPDILIITGLYPTMLFAFIYSVLFRKKIVYMTDGNIDSEKNINRMGKFVRKIVFSYCKCFIGASEKSIELFQSYSIPRNRCFKSCLCIENDKYITSNAFSDRKIDILYCGRLHEGKLPHFLVAVLDILKMHNYSITIIGDGPERESLLNSLSKLHVNYKYEGSLQPDEIIPYYQSARLLFFSTKGDAWGLVANEAIASGTPVITTRFAGVAGELVINNVSGIVEDPSAGLWADKIIEVLEDEKLWNLYSQNGLELVREYNYNEAFSGIIEALDRA